LVPPARLSSIASAAEISGARGGASSGTDSIASPAMLKKMPVFPIIASCRSYPHPGLPTPAPYRDPLKRRPARIGKRRKSAVPDRNAPRLEA
jgi:hypothetical protein